MAYRFKSFADVDRVETPAENANVLVEENGFMKKVPLDAVGGGEDNTTYMVILDADNDWTVTATEGLYEAVVKNLFTDLKHVNIKAFFIEKEYGYVSTPLVRGIYYYPDNEYIGIDTSMGLLYYIYKNGNHDYYYD